MTSFPLPGRLDTAAAAPLRAALLERIERSVPLLFDGSRVEHAGLACLQLLASARATADARGLVFGVDAPSPELAAAVALAGLGDLLEDR